MEPTKPSSKARKAIERIRVLRKSLPVTMLGTAEKRVHTQLSVADASDAALFLYEEGHRADTQEAQ